MLRFVRDVTSVISAHNAMPCWVVFFVELFLDEGGDVLLDVVLLDGLGGAVHCVLLHLFRHVGVLDHCFSFCHSGGIKEKD